MYTRRAREKEIMQSSITNRTRATLALFQEGGQANNLRHGHEHPHLQQVQTDVGAIS